MPLKLNSNFIGIVKTLFFVCVGMCIRICIYFCTLMQSDDIAVIKMIKVNGCDHSVCALHYGSKTASKPLETCYRMRSNSCPMAPGKPLLKREAGV
jgi:hypothetical protein